MVKIVVVNKGGECSETEFKGSDEIELFKKCNFRKSDAFSSHNTWTLKIDGITHNITLWARSSGKHNVINKFEFPPPMDTPLFYGSCALISHKNNKSQQDLTLDVWNKAYTKLFGGFENLADTAKEDENEEDELDNVPAKYKTKEGFLKDGFVVDNDSNETDPTDEHSESELDTDDIDEEDCDDDEDEDEFDDNGSELAPEDYDYSSDDE
jgi:hypothetical protein